MSTTIRVIAMAALASLVADPAWAYIGPGAGLSLLGAFWALLTAVLASIAFLVFWPLRHRMRRAKAANAAKQRQPGDHGEIIESEPLRRDIDDPMR